MPRQRTNCIADTPLLKVLMPLCRAKSSQSLLTEHHRIPTCVSVSTSALGGFRKPEELTANSEKSRCYNGNTFTEPMSHFMYSSSEIPTASTFRKILPGQCTSGNTDVSSPVRRPTGPLFHLQCLNSVQGFCKKN